MSYETRKWQNMPRKEQELVIKVWQNVLEQIKFRAATPGDFGSNFGFFKPKDTLFDTALNALIDLAGTPKYKHVCPGCVFLGSYDREFDKIADLYFCNQGDAVNRPHLTARWADDPDDADRDLGWESKAVADVINKETSSDFLLIAKARASERGLIEPWTYTTKK